MSKDHIKEENLDGVPIEKHDTASWANIEEMKPVSNVYVPNEMEVINAKEWVDSNEK